MFELHSADEGCAIVRERFEGEQWRRRLIDILKSQKMVGGTTARAEKLADLGELWDVQAGDRGTRPGGCAGKGAARCHGKHAHAQVHSG